MYIEFITFFASLIILAVFLGRKLVLVRNGEALAVNEHAHPFVPHLERAGHFTRTNVKKYGYLTLVTTIRFYVRTTNLIKKSYNDFKKRLLDWAEGRNMVNGENGNGESSTFLQMMSEYKSKIREIKHRIHEEEEKK